MIHYRGNNDDCIGVEMTGETDNLAYALDLDFFTVGIAQTAQVSTRMVSCDGCSDSEWPSEATHAVMLPYVIDNLMLCDVLVECTKTSAAILLRTKRNSTPCNRSVFVYKFAVIHHGRH